MGMIPAQKYIPREGITQLGLLVGTFLLYHLQGSPTLRQLVAFGTVLVSSDISEQSGKANLVSFLQLGRRAQQKTGKIKRLFTLKVPISEDLKSK